MLRKLPGIEDEIMLSPCPFCGKDIALIAHCQSVEACRNFEKCDDSHYYTVVCSFNAYPKGCGASSGFYPTAQEAADAWNRRAGKADGEKQP